MDVINLSLLKSPANWVTVPAMATIAVVFVALLSWPLRAAKSAQT